MTDSHRERYPEQYAHPLVGKTVIGPQGRVFVVERVIESGRFGTLAVVPGRAFLAFRVSECTEAPCTHEWDEQPGEPPRDTCRRCGAVRA